jgi:hypothetical protein
LLVNRSQPIGERQVEQRTNDDYGIAEAESGKRALQATVDGFGTVYVTGWSDGGATGYDYAPSMAGAQIISPSTNEADTGVEAQEAWNQALSFQNVLIIRHHRHCPLVSGHERKNVDSARVHFTEASNVIGREDQLKASCVTVNACPAIVMVPWRCAPLFAATVKPTLLLPFPAPYSGDVTVIQDALLLAFHGHALWFCPGSAITLIWSLPPLLPKFSLLRLRLYVHGGELQHLKGMLSLVSPALEAFTTGVSVPLLTVAVVSPYAPICMPHDGS